MKPLSLRSLSTSQKENTNRLNQVLSPESIRHLESSIKERKTLISSSGTSNQWCQNQDGRKATHVVSQAHQSFNYCEKCSIIAASKGFPVQKICENSQRLTQNSTLKTLPSNKKILSSTNKSNTANFRLKTVNKLKQEIYKSEQHLETKYNEVQELLMKSGDKYTHLIEQVTSYFQVIEQMIEYQKYLTYNKVLVERVNNEKDVRQFKDYIENTLEELGKINEDLRENQEMVFTVSHQQFSSIINGYHKTVQHTLDILAVNPEIQIFEHIQFPHFWQNFDELSDSIQLQNQTFLKSRNPLQLSSQKTQLIMSALDLENLSNNFQKLLQNDDSLEKSIQQAIQQNYENNFEEVSEHSFSKKSVFKRKREELNSQMIKNCPKEILLQNGFSMASSITDNEQSSSEEDDQEQLSSVLNRNFNCKTNLFKNYQHVQKMNQFEESLGQYFHNDETLPLNQTQNERSETFLLNH